MKSNWHQWEEMQALGRSLSPHQRTGAAWLYKSSLGSPARNREIDRQRLSPAEVIDLDHPDPSYEERVATGCGVRGEGDDRLFARCIAARREFHVDPYGGMSWCSFVCDPSLRYDLRKGTFREAWEEFIPSCADKVHGGPEVAGGVAGPRPAFAPPGSDPEGRFAPHDGAGVQHVPLQPTRPTRRDPLRRASRSSSSPSGTR